MLLSDLLVSGYTVKGSLLTDRLEKLSNDDRQMIYDVIETLMKYSRRVRP